MSRTLGPVYVGMALHDRHARRLGLAASSGLCRLLQMQGLPLPLERGLGKAESMTET